jgi:hypothetical protein
MAAINFDATEVPPQTAFEALPPGDYVCVISASEEKQTKAGTGSYLQLTLVVIEGEHEGRKTWDRLNLANPNATAVKIAQAQLSAICHAVGVMQLQDSEQLHDIPLLVKVGIEKNKETDELTNKIKGYAAVPNRKPTSKQPAKQSATTTSPAKPTTASPAKAPWARS